MDLLFHVQQALRILILSILTLSGAFAGAQDLVLTDLKTETQSMLARMEIIMDPATKTLDISTYELHNDQVGRTLMAALKSAAERGVRVRLLVDNHIRHSNEALLAELKAAGVQLRFYNPMSIGWSDALRPVAAFNRLNHRMHDKVFLANSAQAIVGDKNYSEKFFRYSLAPEATDKVTMLGKEFYIEGREATHSIQTYFETLWNDPIVAEAVISRAVNAADKVKIQELFAQHLDWIKAQLARRKGGWRTSSFAYDSVQILHDREVTLPDGQTKVDTTLAQILEQVKNAPPGSKILIENSYFVLFPELEVALKTAIHNGCEIHVVLNAPEVTDQRLIGETLRKDLPRMLDLGLNVYLNQTKRRISHAKFVLIGNDIVINGSANIDPRSYRINSESSLMIRSPQLNAHHWERFQNSNSLRQRVVAKANSCAHVFSSSIYAPGGISPLSPKNLLIEAVRPQL